MSSCAERGTLGRPEVAQRRAPGRRQDLRHPRGGGARRSRHRGDRRRSQHPYGARGPAGRDRGVVRVRRPRLRRRPPPGGLPSSARRTADRARRGGRRRRGSGLLAEVQALCSTIGSDVVVSLPDGEAGGPRAADRLGWSARRRRRGCPDACRRATSSTCADGSVAWRGCDVSTAHHNGSMTQPTTFGGRPLTPAPGAPVPELRVARFRGHARRLVWPALVLIVVAGAVGYFYANLPAPFENWMLLSAAARRALPAGAAPVPLVVVAHLDDHDPPGDRALGRPGCATAGARPCARIHHPGARGPCSASGAPER